jgi:hypothetical protein
VSRRINRRPARAPRVALRLLAVVTAAVAYLSLGVASAAASAPPRELMTSAQRPSRPASIGYDISYPQCGGSFPANPAFGIVGVNRGIVFSANPCLGAGDGPSELAWAGLQAGFYANTGNPGPELSSHWPVGQTSPRSCLAAEPDTADCAYDYGWNAAADAYATAVQAFVSLGWADPGDTRTPVAGSWWLDVETANSWRTDTSLNVAALQGAADYLGSVEVASIGFYSTPTMWSQVTGGTEAFAGYRSWVAGARTLQAAKKKCVGAGFTGGGVQLSQYPKNGFDANYPC